MSSDNNEIGSGFVKPLFGARYPTRTINRSRLNPYRSAQLTMLPKVSNDKVAVLNEQLSKVQKMMLEDTFIADGTVRRALTLYAYFLLGKRTKTTVDINREFMTPELQEQVLADTFKNKEINEFRTYIDRINRQVKLQEKLEGATIQALVGGRSVLLVEEDQGVPFDLKLLNWGKLGRVFADKDTWRLLAVEYADRPKEQPLMAEEIIYFTWQDYNVAPDSLYHGTSAVLPVVDISETKRIILAEDMKETARTSYSDNGVVKFPPNTDKSSMENFTKEFIGGRWHATSKDVEIQTFGLKPKVAEMASLVRDIDLMTSEYLGIPQFLMSSERVPNRAVADLAMNAWRESDLNHARSWLQGIIEPQWYDSLMLLRYPDIEIENFWLKAKLEFEDITFETLKDRTEAIIPLFQAGLITIEKALKILDMEDVLEQIQAQQKLFKQQRDQELEMMRLEKKEQEEQDGSNFDGRGRNRREEDEEEEEETIRARQASITKEDFEKSKQEILEKLAKAAEQPKPIPQQQNNDIEKKLQDRQMKLIEQETTLRMSVWQEQKDLLERAKARMAMLEQKNSS